MTDYSEVYMSHVERSGIFSIVVHTVIGGLCETCQPDASLLLSSLRTPYSTS